MNDTTTIEARPSWLPRTVLLAVVCLTCLGSVSLAAGADGPGWVDAEPFLDLAGEDNLAIEISIQGALLRVLGQALNSEDPDLASTVTGLDRIYTAVIDIEGSERRSRGRELVRQTAKRLEARDWQRLARVRDSETSMDLMILEDDGTVNGLVVLIEEKTEGQLVFVNIAGRIDLAQLEELGREMDIPGLENLSEEP